MSEPNDDICRYSYSWKVISILLGFGYYLVGLRGEVEEAAFSEGVQKV